MDKAGHLLAWGSNRYGQLGLGQRGTLGASFWFLGPMDS